MKILLTGYRGFIGQNMRESLESDGHELSLFEWGDDLPDLTGFDWCIHLGAITSTTETNVDRVLEQNYDFSRYLINECQKYGINLQYSSSASVYGPGKLFEETAPVQPQSPYSWSKYLFERYVSNFANRWSIRTQGFRYFNVYGKYEDHKDNQASPFHKFKKQALEFGKITLFKGSEQYVRDFVPVETIVDVHKKFFDINQSGIWNIGTGKTKSFFEIAQEISQETGAEIEFIDMPEHISKQYQSYTCANITKLNQTLGNE